MSIIQIYYLHKGDNKPFYVGKTKNIKIRILDHKNKFGRDTQIQEITSVPLNEWKHWEQYYIDLYTTQGFILKNKNKGGGGSTNLTEYTKQLISKKLLGREYPQEWKDKVSLATKGKPKHNSITRGLNISKAKKGKPNPKLKETRTGKPHPKQGWKIKQFDLHLNHLQDWEDAKTAGEILNIKPALIRDAAIGKQKTAGGYKWQYDK
jgi:hypothetical protein